jgi:hypothetical protein
LIKTRGRKILPEIHKYINSTWNEEELAPEWMESVILPIYKEGDKKLIVLVIAALCQVRTKFFPTSDCCMLASLK